ncbi:MAG: iron ABC transporter permease [Robiginitomaculum sp.]|nr:MAG: iron ABC transporter permease [Robiginitomaculum sp.]
MHKSLSVWTLATVVLALVLSMPILVVLRAVFSTDTGGWAHLFQTNLASYIFNTLGLLLMTGMLATLMGVSTAWLIAATAFKGRRMLSWALMLPLAAPSYIIAYMYTDLLASAGPIQSGLRHVFGWQAGEYYFPSIRNLFGASLMLALVLYPYIYLLARIAFSSKNSAQIHAARTLGLTASETFWRVALPTARPAIIGGLALVLMETLADFGVADYFAIPTFSTGIFRTWLLMGEKVAALKLAGIMLLFVIALLWLEYQSRKGDTTGSTRPIPKPIPIQLTKRQSVLAMCVCGFPVIFGFVIPVLGLSYYTFTGGDEIFGVQFYYLAKASLTIASIVAVLTMIIAIILAYTNRVQRSPITRGAIVLSTLGYALPGALLAVGLLGTSNKLDKFFTGFAVEYFGWQGGLVISGTIALLVYACVVRFLTIGFNSVNTRLESIPMAMDAAARALGQKPLGVIRRIHLPLMRSSMVAAGLLVFVDVMRELPATLILRPFNFETLATRVYRLASDERLSEASTAALTIIAISLIPILILNRSQK